MGARRRGSVARGHCSEVCGFRVTWKLSQDEAAWVWVWAGRGYDRPLVAGRSVARL